MNIHDFIYHKLLLNEVICGMSYKKVMKNVELKAHLQKYKDFVNEHFDKKMIADFFKVGVKAKVFKDNRTGKTLTDKDHLFTGFEDLKYQYTLRRQPLHTPAPRQPTIQDLVESARGKE